MIIIRHKAGTCDHEGSCPKQDCYHIEDFDERGLLNSAKIRIAKEWIS